MLLNDYVGFWSSSVFGWYFFDVWFGSYRKLVYFINNFNFFIIFDIVRFVIEI